MIDSENKTALTAQDVADILKIAKNTVYELIKRGEINSYKVGRKVRFTSDDIEEYISRSRRLGSFMADERPVERVMPKLEDDGGNFVICGQDVILDILSHYLGRHPWGGGRPALRSHIGSFDGLIALYHGEVQVATSHLWDGDTGEYNRPYVRRLLPGIRTIIVRLARRTQGLFVARGNPKGISGWSDFTRADLMMINREKGAGSRVLLDEHLRLLGVFGRMVKGYANEAQSHHSVASAVARGEADLAVGLERAGEQLGGVDFIRLQTEEYDLVIKKEDLNLPLIRALMEILRSDKFQREIAPMTGYDLTGMGEIVAET